MIDFNAEIRSGHSIGNVELNENISKYIANMYSDHKVVNREFVLPNGDMQMAYMIDDTMTIVTNSDGLIFSIGCNKNYTGLYKNKLRPGLNMSEISKQTFMQRIFNGTLIIDDDFGLSLVIPPPYDEIADEISHIPHNLIFPEIYVADYSSWNPSSVANRAIK